MKEVPTMTWNREAAERYWAERPRHWDPKEEEMARYNEYQVIHINERSDGRVEQAGTERVVMTYEEALAMSHSAIVVSMERGFGGSATYIFEGRHAQFDGHLGWPS